MGGPGATLKERLRRFLGPPPTNVPQVPEATLDPPVTDVVEPVPGVLLSDADFLAFAPRRPRIMVEDAIDEAVLADFEVSLRGGLRVALEESPASFPWFAQEILAAAEHPEADAATLTRLVARDPLIAAQVLRVANSAHYSRGTPVTDLRSAVARLGLREVASIAAVACTQALMNPTRRRAVQEFPGLWRRIWIHAIASSLATSAWLSSHGASADAPVGFMCGLLHDVGKMVGLQGLGFALTDIPARGDLFNGLQGDVRIPEAYAAALLERMHVSVGVRLATRSRFPDALIAACRDHHAAPAAGAQNRVLNTVVVVAVVEEILAGNTIDATWMDVALQRAACLRLNPNTLSNLAGVIRSSREKAEAILASA
jgi:HD-like signal output (HDOD) protein